MTNNSAYPTTATAAGSQAAAPRDAMAPERLVGEWLRSLAVGIVNCSAYGSSHAVTQHGIDDSYRLLEEEHKLSDAVEIRLVKEGVQINGRPCRTADILERKLRQLPVQSVMMTRGMSREDYGKLIVLIHEGTPKGAEGGEDAFFRKVDAANIRNLIMRKSQFVEMYEMVVSKDQAVGGAAGAGGTGSPGGTGGSGTAGTAPSGGTGAAPGGATPPAPTAGTLLDGLDTVSIQLPTAVVAKIVAFLHGSTTPEEEDEARKAIHGAAGDAQQLAGLILKAVVARQQEAPLADLGEIVVACLRRAVAGMKKAPGWKTQKAQHETIRALTAVDALVRDYVHKQAEEGKALEADAQPVARAVRELKIQIEAESIVSQFTRHRHAMTDAAETLTRFISRHGPEQIEAAGVRHALLESGLTPEGWNQLATTGRPPEGGPGRGTGPGGPGSGSGDGGADSLLLANLLANLTTLLKQAGNAPRNDDVERLATQIDGQLASRIALADGKIDQLAEAARRMALAEPTAAGAPAAQQTRAYELDRRTLLLLVADITREFRQPLSVIGTSASALQDQATSVGTLTPVQQRLVALIQGSLARIDTLTTRLERIL